MKKDEFLHLLDKLDILDSRLDSIVTEMAARKPMLDKIAVIEDEVSTLSNFHNATKSIIAFVAFIIGGVSLFEYFKR